jgi:hypothetical protein
LWKGICSTIWMMAVAMKSSVSTEVASCTSRKLPPADSHPPCLVERCRERSSVPSRPMRITRSERISLNHRRSTRPKEKAGSHHWSAASTRGGAKLSRSPRLRGEVIMRSLDPGSACRVARRCANSAAKTMQRQSSSAHRGDPRAGWA